MQRERGVQRVLYKIYMSEYKQLKFEPGAMSIVQMGEELIGHPTTAINELVKNSYDADADKCWVYTEYNKDAQKNFLIIKDNGLGMDSSTLFGDWLKPSVSSKRDEDKGKRKSLIYERRYLGSKGIGRLASMALGQILTVVTKKSTEPDYNWLKIDREQFKKGGLLNEISFPGGIISDFINLFSDEENLKHFGLEKNDSLVHLLKKYPFNNFKEGTMIIVQNLDDSIRSIVEEEFNIKEIDETTIFKSLRDLITPLKLNIEIQEELVQERILDKSLKIDNGSSSFDLFYGINLIEGDTEKAIDFILVEASKILSFYDYRVVGKVTAGYEVIGKYICQRKIERKVEDLQLESTFVLSPEEREVRKIEELDTDNYEVTVGEYYFDFRVYDLDDDVKDEMVKRLKVKGRREATQTFSKYLGVKITKNGFGVKPYGEDGQDWLGLGGKRVNKHIVSIGPNQIIGYTFLYSPQNDALNEKTNREGFFESKAFVNFKKTIGAILEDLGRRRAVHRAFHNLGRKISSRLDRPDSEQFLEFITNNSNDEDLIAKTKEFVKDTNTALDNMQDSLTFSQRLASLGMGLELLFHEISQPITSIGGTVNSLYNNFKDIQDEILKLKLEKRAGTIRTAVDTLDVLKESLRPAIGKSMPKEFLIVDTFQKVCHLFENQFNDYNVRLEIHPNAFGKKIKAFEYIFWISFLNIVNNAMYWLKDSQLEKCIVFKYEEPNTFIISNTGPLILFSNDIEEIFDYGVTSRKERNATGLGLAFARSLLSAIDWEIHAENSPSGPEFYITQTILKK